MYNLDYYHPHHHPYDSRDPDLFYDVDSHHSIWHPDEVLRERALEELSLANHELSHLEFENLQLERERAMALNDAYMIPAVSDLHPGYSTLEPYGMGYGGINAVHSPGYPLRHPPHYDPPVPIPLVNEPLYHHPTFQAPRSVPMSGSVNVPMMDPYFLNSVMPGPMPVPIPVNSMQNPFLYGIDHDYGHGPIRPLANYGLSPGGLEPGYGRILDDLYLFEMMVRLDRTLDERERLIRWQERLAWEELSQAERQLRWQQMDFMELSRLGLGAGSYWGNELGGLPIDTSFGYFNPMLGLEVMECYRPLGEAPIMGVCGQPHLPMSPALMSQYPIWNTGGLGLGARISHWLNEFGSITPKNLIRRENMLRDYAERRGEIPPGHRLVEPDRMGFPYTSYM